MKFFSGFSFRQTTPVQGACGGRAPRSRPKCLSGEEGGGGGQNVRESLHCTLPSSSHQGKWAKIMKKSHFRKFRVRNVEDFLDPPKPIAKTFGAQN